MTDIIKLTLQRSEKKRGRKEYSKVILGAVVILYFAGAVFGAAIVYLEHEMLGELLAYIGAPTATAVGFYYWKAKAENITKMSKTQIEKLKTISETEEYEHDNI